MEGEAIYNASQTILNLLESLRPCLFHDSVEVYKSLTNGLSFWVHLISVVHSNMASKPEISSSSVDRGFISSSAPLFPHLHFCLSLHVASHLRLHLWLHVCGGVEVYKWIAYLFPMA